MPTVKLDRGRSHAGVKSQIRLVSLKGECKRLSVDGYTRSEDRSRAGNEQSVSVPPIPSGL